MFLLDVGMRLLDSRLRENDEGTAQVAMLLSCSPQEHQTKQQREAARLRHGGSGSRQRSNSVIRLPIGEIAGA
jgi:hypothetical protein